LSAKGERNGELRASPGELGHDYLELWFSLARQDWGSLIVIPADRDGSTADIANTLASIGQRLSYGPVTAITVTTLEYGSALALADLQQHVKRQRRLGGRTVQRVNTPPEAGAAARIPVSDPPRRNDAAQPAPAAPHPLTADPGPAVDGVNGNEALMVIPPARLIISVPPVVSEPLALTAAEEADAVVLAVRLNRSPMAEVKRSIKLVGRERISGCLLVR
jgi:hypothetical protein